MTLIQSNTSCHLDHSVVSMTQCPSQKSFLKISDCRPFTSLIDSSRDRVTLPTNSRDLLLSITVVSFPPPRRHDKLPIWHHVCVKYRKEKVFARETDDSIQANPFCAGNVNPPCRFVSSEIGCFPDHYLEAGVFLKLDVVTFVIQILSVHTVFDSTSFSFSIFPLSSSETTYQLASLN